MLHRSISINTLSLAPAAPSEQVEAVARLGARGITPEIAQFDASGALDRHLRDSGLAVAAITHRAFGFADPDAVLGARTRLLETIALASKVGAGSVIMTTGGRGDLAWPEAAARFVEAVAPCAEAASAAGVTLGIEPTSHLYADSSIAHRLADTVALAARANIAPIPDLFACWFDSDIDAAIAAAAPLAPLVQVSDYVPGDRGLPCRAVPGDGMAGWDRLVPALVRAGFTGWFDLEIIGPRLGAEGHEAGLRRAAANIGTWLEAAGTAP